MAALGWIGLGRIGAPMAARLASYKNTVTAFDINVGTVTAAVAAGVHVARSAAEAAQGADAIFLCVSDAKAVEQAVFGSSGVASTAPRGAIIVDHTTIHPDQCRALAKRAIEAGGLGWVDAPVSGGTQAAESGRLTIWYSGDPADGDRALPYLKAYAAKLSYMGPSGRALIAKSCNQAIVSGTIALWAEMLRYARDCGLDPLELIASMEGSSADTPTSRHFAIDLANGAFPELSDRNMNKDLGVVIDLARTHGTAMPLATAAYTEFSNGIARGLGPDVPAKR
jgi:3-hydroxyisobutyrate dehydrogenase